jgi:hypothetical protein
MYENGKIRQAKIIPRMARGKIKENDGGVNFTKIYSEHFCKCHNVLPVQ